MNVIRIGIAFVLVLTTTLALAAEVKEVQGKVITVSQDYGNLDTSFTPKDIKGLGVNAGDSFQVGFGGKRFEVYLGQAYSDVPKGDWVAFFTQAGTLRIARNLDNAAKTLGVKEGDALTLYH